MGRPPQTGGGPAFRFTLAEVAEMEAHVPDPNTPTVPSREVLCTLAEKFSASAERAGKTVVQPKQVWNWFQNRRYATKSKLVKSPGKLSVSSLPRDDSVPMRNAPHFVPGHVPVPVPVPAPPGRSQLENNIGQMEFEAKSARDGAWYDVATFVSQRGFVTGEPEVRVRFAGFGAEEDEWVNVRKNVRQRSLPCEASECVAVLPGDLILCFQEGRDQALYFDAHVIDSQRRRHDVRGCRCRFLVKYDHDESEEIVPLRKVCRRPESDYRLHLLHASKEVASMDLNKVGRDTSSSNPRGTNSSIGAEKTQQRQVKTQEISTGNMVVTSVPSLAKPLELNKMGGHTSSISTPRAMSTSVGVETTQGYVRPEVNAEDDVVIISPPSHTNNPVDKDITIVATPVAPVATGDASLPVNAAAATATSDATSAVDTTTT